MDKVESSKHIKWRMIGHISRKVISGLNNSIHLLHKFVKGSNLPWAHVPPIFSARASKMTSHAHQVPRVHLVTSISYISANSIFRSLFTPLNGSSSSLRATSLRAHIFAILLKTARIRVTMTVSRMIWRQAHTTPGTQPSMMVVSNSIPLLYG